MKETQSFPQNYTAHDKRDGHVIGCYTNIDELIEEVNDYCIAHRGYRLAQLFQGHMKADSVKIEKRVNYVDDFVIPDPKPRFWHPSRKFIIEYINVDGVYVLDSLGNIVKDIWKLQTRKPYRSYAEKHEYRDRVLKTLERTAGNANRIKAPYGYHMEVPIWRRDKTLEWVSDYWINRRTPATLSNIKKLSFYIKEDGEPQARGKQRNLPNSWDDLTCNVWRQTKSWKHNSKRKSQWKDRSNE